MKVIKRDGLEKSFKKERIGLAISKAYYDIYNRSCKATEIQQMEDEVVDSIGKREQITVEEIQDIVVRLLMIKDKKVGKAYQYYREERSKERERKSKLMRTVNAIGVETDRDNANVGNNFSSKLLRIASETNKINNLNNMPKHLANLHNGDLYYHDLDSYNLTINCLNIDTGKVLKKGFNTGYGTINVPNRIESAAELSCILLQATQNDMFGGQSHVNFDNDMAYFVEPTRDELAEEYKYHDKDFIEEKLNKRIHQAMQGIVYNLNTMHSRAGSQVPFSSINLGIPKSHDAYLICKAFLEEYEKGLGKGEQPIFPNIIFRVKDGVNKKPTDRYYDLFKLACRVASKRMNPTFMNLDADFNLAFYNKGIIPATMGCRTYVCSNINGREGAESRGNIAPTTINLPRIGILAKGDLNTFFELLDTRLLQARESLLHRYGVLKRLKVKDLPFVAGQGLLLGSEGLDQNDSIEPILKNGTWGIGFIGLAETLTALVGQHHGQSDRAKQLGIFIVKNIRNFCDKYKEIDKLNWSCYATPAEGLSGKFIKQDKKEFGIIKGITDKDYYTNSFHIPAGFDISMIDKINIEAPYHEICNGGHISYIEVDGYPTPQTIEKIIQYAYGNTNINYVGINFHMRYCKDCGERIEENMNECPSCHSHDIQGISRVTGYLSLDERFGEGKSAEREDRISHDGSHEKVYRSIGSDS